MGVRHRLSTSTAAALAACALVALAGCKKRETETTRPPPRAPDKLAPDESPEGAEMLHGLRLPRRSRVADQLGPYTIVRSQLPADQLATYVRQRVEGGNVTAGAASTVLNGVTAKGGDPTALLEIKVQPTHDPAFTSEMHVRVLPKPQLPPEATEEERWRAAGVTPDGKLIDRQKRE